MIDVPKDMTAPSEKFAYAYPEEVFIRSYQPSLKGHSGQIKKAVETLLAAKRPIIYSGGGVVLGNAHKELTNLAHRLNLPVTNTLMGLGAFPGSDSQFLGMLGMHGTYEANMTMHHADVILAVGARFDDRVTNNVKKFCPNATIIHIDIDPTSISKTINAHIPIVGDVKSVLTDIIEIIGEDKELDQPALLDWWSQINEWRKRHGLRYDTSTDNGIKPQAVVQALDKVTNSNAIITSDVGQHQMFAALYYTYNEPRQWLNSGGLGTMGVGLPYAMAAKLANPERDVVCITGEGSIQMNIQELSTCLQYNLPVKILNLNNAQLGMVKQWQDMLYEGRHAHSYMNSLPDFVKLAESYGHVGIKITDPATMEAQLAEAMAITDRLVFIDVYVDRNEHVYPMQIAGQAMRDMWLTKGAYLMQQQHLISVLMENEAGSLSRVVGLFSQRGYNIETLNVAPTDDSSISRLTLTTITSPEKIEQITKQLHKLIEVVKVLNLSDTVHVERELMLIKVRATGGVREEIKRSADIFRAQIVDVNANLYTIQIVGDKAKLDGFIDVIGRERIMEVVRSGVIGIARGEKTLSL